MAQFSLDRKKACHREKSQAINPIYEPAKYPKVQWHLQLAGLEALGYLNFFNYNWRRYCRQSASSFRRLHSAISVSI